jgi:hypothetical protein
LDFLFFACRMAKEKPKAAILAALQKSALAFRRQRADNKAHALAPH